MEEFSFYMKQTFDTLDPFLSKKLNNLKSQ